MRVLETIGRGGFARVERVQNDSGVIVARKVFDPDPAVLAGTDPDKLRKRFEREVRVQKTLASPHLMPVLEYNLTESTPWYTMPLAEKTLEQLIAGLHGDTTGAVKALADVLNGLEEIHALGYVHRDLTPRNVLLVDSIWRLADFGLILPPRGITTKLTGSRSAWGTQDYAAPEQALDFRAVTPAADIYAFGCILHDIWGTSPRIPFQQHHAPGAIGRVIAKCTELDPLRRFDTVARLRSLLISIQQLEEAGAPSAGATAWNEKIAALDQWTASTLEDLVRYLHQENGYDDELAVNDALDEDNLERLHALESALWESLALAYARWAEGAFLFAYCDVIVRRLEVLFALGSPEVQAAAAIAAARLGASHNRYYVMGRVLRLCGGTLDAAIADRIAIEIKVEGRESDFTDCAEVINRPVESYHPKIVAALK